MNPLILKNILKNFDRKKEKGSDGTVQLADFEMLDIIGQGAFGKVRVIEHQPTKKCYALKYINKEECIKSGTLKNIFRERVILQDLEHAHILCLRYAFQDDEHLFFVFDWAKGSDLSFNLKRVQTFPLQPLRVYAAELSSALDYLHSQSIIHRDLKPENLLLDSQGHIYITDFNCSVCLKERTPNSKAGTLEYMAPEMFLGCYYTFSVDWWALGAVLFQLAYGFNLFKEKTPEATQEAISAKPIEFSSPDQPSPVFVDFVRGLLKRELKDRLGAAEDGHGFCTQIKTHPLFDGLDWSRLKEMEVGYTPFPTGNYDHGHMIHEQQSGDKLSQKVKSLKKKSGWLVSRVSTCFSGKSIRTDLGGSDLNLTESPVAAKPREVMEMELMEKYFCPYDFQNKAENQPVVMPPSLISKRRDTNLQKKPSFNTKDAQVAAALSRKTTEKLSPLRNGAPEASPNAIRMVKRNEDASFFQVGHPQM